MKSSNSSKRHRKKKPIASTPVHHQSIPIKTVPNPIKSRPLQYKTLEIEVEKDVPHKIVLEFSSSQPNIWSIMPIQDNILYKQFKLKLTLRLQDFSNIQCLVLLRMVSTLTISYWIYNGKKVQRQGQYVVPVVFEQDRSNSPADSKLRQTDFVLAGAMKQEGGVVAKKCHDISNSPVIQS
ncbi:unnamed protein product [Bursaphelenchus okinawaensis]|uniref:Uncharacterized protein n=1 Tax=Bursaphelenchus okinawaensis TaxID=465554 RepID=A0A811LDX4_9BILA|nr:unnamed protein product [Bursaphelenchus okinawaensis]CAG9121285.1 unnamed protein product [Bursaphelenchus okinawaensis]